jgi:KDO2-lipid IV(A) lauroyltransferase
VARAIFWLLGRLPLSWLHAIGAAVGWAWCRTSRRESRRARDNLRLVYPDWSRDEIDRTALAVLQQTGASFFELPWLWTRPPRRVLAALTVVEGEALYRAALSDGRGLIIAAPHLGAWEALNLYLSSCAPISVLYRPPKSAWVERLINAGRERLGANAVAADAGGVRALVRTLRAGGTVGILPDQVPRAGEGEWAPFFGHAALTMSLLPKLAERTSASVLFAWAERLPRGGGYALRFVDAGSIGDTASLNRAVERLARQCPAQYQWTYKRFPGETYQAMDDRLRS